MTSQFNIATKAVEEQKDNDSCLSGGYFGKLFYGKKKNKIYKGNTVKLSEGYAWNEHSEGRDKQNDALTA